MLQITNRSLILRALAAFTAICTVAFGAAFLESKSEQAMTTAFDKAARSAAFQQWSTAQLPAQIDKNPWGLPNQATQNEIAPTSSWQATRLGQPYDETQPTRLPPETELLDEVTFFESATRREI